MTKRWIMNTGGGFGVWCGPYTIRERANGSNYVIVEGKRYTVVRRLLEGLANPDDCKWFEYAPGEEAWHYACTVPPPS